MPENEKIDLNEAGAEELSRIEGVGEYVAGQIVQHREQHGRFERVEDLKEVYNVDETMIEKIRPHVEIRRAA